MIAAADRRQDQGELACQVAVVGSGAGGAVVAHVLAQAGRDTVLIESGAHHDPATFDQREATMMPRLYHDGGQQMTADQAMVVLTGQGLGGSTVHNTGMCVPTPPAILDRFEREAGLPATRAELESTTAWVLDRLRARPMREEDTNRSNRLLRLGAERLGLATVAPLHNREICDGCGFCILGCAYNRKRHVVFAFLEDAVASGLRIVTERAVTRIDRRASRWVVSGPGLRVVAEKVVLAAGALRTPGLILSNRLADPSSVGRSLRLHPFAPVAGVFDEPVDAYRGIPQSTLVTGDARFLQGERGGWVLMAAPAHPATAAVFVPGVGFEVRERMRRFRHLASGGVLLHDEVPSRVGVRRDGRPSIRSWPSGPDEVDLRAGIAALCRVWLAAGAREVLVPFGRRPVVRNEDDIRRLAELAFRPYDVALTSVHPHASVPLGRESRAPVRPDGGLRGAPGVFVADASILPSSVGVPPQVTIMTWAACIAGHVLAEAVA